MNLTRTQDEGLTETVEGIREETLCGLFNISTKPVVAVNQPAKSMEIMVEDVSPGSRGDGMDHSNSKFKWQFLQSQKGVIASPV